MRHYLDTSVVVAMVLRDTHTTNALAWFESTTPTIFISTFTKTEFSAVASRQVRIRQQSVAEALLALQTLDRWLGGNAQMVPCSNDDIVSADLLVRDFATKLGAPDAIHLAMARRLGATLATFDERQADAARRHAIPVVIPE